MNPKDLDFVLTNHNRNILRGTEYCIYGNMSQLTELYYTLLKLAELHPPTQSGIWIGDIKAWHAHFNVEHVKHDLSAHQDECWHFIFEKDIKFTKLHGDQNEYGIYFSTAGFGSSGVPLIKNLLNSYYDKLCMAYRDIAVVNDANQIRIEDKEKKYFKE